MISANTVFHFTSSVENIKNILTNHFRPRVCLERIDYIKKEKLDFGLPMVCFCDIPLSEVGNHIKTYGEYAIGLNKSWAIKNGITPVLYLHEMSKTLDSINHFFEVAGKYDTQLNQKEYNYLISSYQLFSYCKAYHGSMQRNEKLKKKIRFYDEREWRYVPEYRLIQNEFPKFFLDKDEYLNKEIRQKYNNLLSEFKIKFSPKDIQYIIVSKEKERGDMISSINGIKEGYYTPNEIDELKSKIISVEQIKGDF